ncbi:hypothetical protein [Streptomyces sp. NPDC004728]|uniref:hypothetical protein n=1 Tax=Streptomyces sp. NPDC004728 TaxID=3154289 RepID=UPI0033A9F57E
MVERMERYGNGELDLEFQQIAITADDLRSGRLTTHDVNTRNVKYMRFREECLREGIDPHTAVEVEALRPKLLRQRPGEAVEGLTDDVRQLEHRGPRRRGRARAAALPARNSEEDRPAHRAWGPPAELGDVRRSSREAPPPARRGR